MRHFIRVAVLGLALAGAAACATHSPNIASIKNNPGRYYDRIERQGPAYTVKDGIAAPKFGSAASGGLENEPAPKR